MLLKNVPVRLVAELHNTAITHDRKHYRDTSSSTATTSRATRCYSMSCRAARTSSRWRGDPCPTLLEIWRELNHDRDGEPSSLMVHHAALHECSRTPTSKGCGTSARTPTAREMREAMRQVAERLMGRMRPVSPAQPDKPKPKPSPVLVALAASHQPKSSAAPASCAIWAKCQWMPRVKTLGEAGIKGERSAVYSLIWKPAYASR